MSADFGWSDADFARLAFITQMALVLMLMFFGLSNDILCR